MKTMLKALGDNPTYSEVRSAGALCASYPFVLYSDLYDHNDFIRGVVNSGFAGILWSPEVRDAKTPKEFIRRLQTNVFSAQCLINGWYLETLPCDLCNLQTYENGRVEYIRAKTHKPYSIKVETEANEIIQKYSGEKHLLNYLDTYKNYRSFYMNMCNGLKAIKQRLNDIDDGVTIKELTSYWARHSWATIAAYLDIPKDTIAAALGHGGNTVTDIYIEFDMRKVDEANRKVLDYVLYDKT